MSAKRVTIIGLGLIGGSLGLALKKVKGAEIEVVGCARRSEVGEKAIQLGAVDKTEKQLDKAVSNANIVIVATPITAIKDIFDQIASHLSPNTIVSDVGSTKSHIMKWAEEYLPQTVNFIGGHPMTGKETAGIEEAEASLFDGSAYCLIPSRNASNEAFKSMNELVNWIGAKSVSIEAKPHDELVAGISHLPMILSSALVSTLAKSSQWPDMSKLAASGYRDTTRLASGDAKIQMGICATNRRPIIEWIDSFIKQLEESREMILQNDDDQLRAFFQQTRETREHWLKNEGHRFLKQEPA